MEIGMQAFIKRLAEVAGDVADYPVRYGVVAALGAIAGVLLTVFVGWVI